MLLHKTPRQERPTESEIAAQFAALGLPRDQRVGDRGQGRPPYTPLYVYPGDTASTLLQRYGAVSQQPPVRWAWKPVGFLPAVAFEEQA